MGNRAERHESETESNGLVERERVREREREEALACQKWLLVKPEYFYQ